MRLPLRPHLSAYVCSSCRHGLLNTRLASTSASPPIPEIYDIVCVGGGPAGLALLAALRASPITSKLKVALVESQDISKAKQWKLDSAQYSNRVSSLTPSSVAFLQKIGVWAHVDASRVQPYEEMEVWDGVTGSRISFDWSANLLPGGSSQTIATMTENANLIRGLLSRIESLGDGVSVFSSTTVAAIENGVDHSDGPDLSAWPVLSLSSSSAAAGKDSELPKIAARLLVGADGINSPVRSFADISTDGWDYNRHGVVATLELSPSDTSSLKPVTAYQRFLPGIGGPVAMLPLPGNYATLVWSTTVQNAAYLKSLPPEAFTSMVNAAFRLSMTDLNYMFTLPSSSSDPSNQHNEELSWRLNHTPCPSSIPPMVGGVQPRTIASFPLRHRHASTYISPRIALVGDAAHVIHPLGGLGLNLGVADVASLHGSIEYAIQHGMDIGDLLSLERYAADRWYPNAKIGAGCDFLHKLYNVPGNGPVAWARGFGLDMVNRVPAVKNILMKVASGA
ncbi:putative ubiquinone biosynthesis monooxygenase [Ophidiomyces ophidiicola]|uniref:Ubiquinone biosynthesis monooxygenase n=1 Tax=Ophidiomyces ophidiicola TaxID=1387563 RepID=A0ACB8UTZ5_9EURO|nr:putative ubiquinone biosynthesis monooxygenase [Ophidiomyces ophidiicola]KAI1913254.1 putative ubiquinone biosynthesis monooxygenase [Ophidiomyces ophidiicola]KAI1941011.1 putative ubiquinone biosynthesis monooxygenase [Ophidiomyces ophidiicola]KAI1944553.1 putative ubiquinone biosynthesis monooxygenase [Ophidiomyces ophidiicola]KAI2004731.1 putative ubiquinone biosynthesis monooxygenase [Ophidiomyces ophidiicola]KAI2028760.1 putative ubiquinone biosynthesis monooxygenase [Ophidiomyces ophi